MFVRDTIRRFSANTSEFKRMGARNYEDFLQVGHIGVVVRNGLLINWQCAIPVSEGLLPEPHNGKVLQLLFTFGHWHGLAKLRMHTDTTLVILDDETTCLGNQLRQFQSNTCSAFTRWKLMHETKAQERHGKKEKKEHSTAPHNSQNDMQGRKRKVFNLQTYKVHSMGDYVSTIKHYGTTDSYTTAIVSF